LKPLFWVWKWPITSYSLLLLLGILAGSTAFAGLGKKRWGLEKALDALLWSLIGGIAFGRVGFVLTNLEYFSESPREAWQFWKGGLAFSFALAGGLLALFIFSRFQKVSLAELLDLASLSILPAQALGWWACYTAGLAYGKEWKGPLALFLPDVYGVKAYRFPVQLAEALWSALLFLILLVIYWRANKAGNIFLAYAIGYLPFDFFLRFLRGDVIGVIGPLEPGQLSVVLVLTSLLLSRFIYPKSSSGR